MNKLTNFSVTVYGAIEPYNQTMSKARVRIFTRGLNVNRSFIDDDVAEQLIATLPYTPVKGIYDKETQDFRAHRVNKDEIEQIYGMVPIEMNFAWEPFVEDGKIVEYACSDILLWTSIHPEASSIIDKAQSMELFGPSIDGHWEYENGIKFFKFKKASFLGLQILGDQTMPAFKSAGFYSAYANFAKALQENTEEQKTDAIPRPIFNRKEDPIFEALWDYVNPNYSEDGIIVNEVLSIKDDVVQIFNFEKEEISEYRVVFEGEEIMLKDKEQFEEGKDEEIELPVIEETPSVVDNPDSTIEDPENIEDPDPVITVGENPDSTIVDTGEGPQTEDFSEENIEENIEENLENSTEKEEPNDEETTLNIEKEVLENLISALEKELNELKEEIEPLREYKRQAEVDAKQEVINKYRAKLPSEVIDRYSDEIDNYSLEDLKKELAYELVESSDTIFSNNTEKTVYVPKNSLVSGIEGILAQYENKKKGGH